MDKREIHRYEIYTYYRNEYLKIIELMKNIENINSKAKKYVKEYVENNTVDLLTDLEEFFLNVLLITNSMLEKDDDCDKYVNMTIENGDINDTNKKN